MRDTPRGLVESKARQQIARVLVRNGPLTARRLAGETGHSRARSRYHLRVLATGGAVRPFLRGPARGDEIGYSLTPANMPEWAREALLGEVSLHTCFRLAGILLFEGRQDVAELAVRLDLSDHEVTRHLEALGLEGLSEGMPRHGTGSRADRLSDHDSAWADWRFEDLGTGDDGSSPRKDDAE